MADGIFYPVVNGDDGFSASGVFEYSYDKLIFGSGWGNFYGDFVRFPNVTIPKESVITGCYVKFTAYSGDSDNTCSAICYFNDVDDAVAPTNTTEFNALALTGAIAWNAIPSWINGTQYDTPELKTILQNIVDRGSWASGNALQFITKDNSSSAKRQASAVDFLSGAEKAELHVTWTPPLSANGNNVESLPEITPPEITFFSKGVVGSNVESSSEVTAPALRLIGELEDIPCNTQITNPSFSRIRSLVISNVECLTEVGQPWLKEPLDVNASDVSALTQITVPILSKNLDASDVESSSEITSPLLRQCCSLETTLPMITCDIQGGHGGFMEGTLPCITAEMRGGAILEATLPMITAEITGKVGIVGEFEVTLPRITASFTGKTETLGELEAILPMIRAHITGKTGEVGELNATLPMITCDIQGYFGITGELEATLPMIKAYMVGTLDRFAACDVLRFTEPAVTKSLTLSDVESAPSIGAASL